MAQALRWMQVIEMLTAKGRVEENELAEMMKVSAQTVKTSIEHLNRHLLDIATITKVRHEYFIEVFDYDELAFLMRGGLKAKANFNSSNKRIAYIIKRLLDLNDYLFIDDLAEEIQISRGTINKDLKKLKKIVAEFGGQLSTKQNKGIMLVANEFTKRLLFFYHVYDYYPYDLKMDSNFFKILDRLYDDLSLSQTAIDLLERGFMISIDRIKKDRLIDETIPNYTNFYSDSNKLDEIFYEIEEILGRNLTQMERDFIAFPLNMNNNFDFDESKVDLAGVRQIVNQILIDISKEYPVEIDGELLFDSLKYHLVFLYNRTVFHYVGKDLFYETIQKQYPFAYQLATLAAKSIHNFTGLKISSVEINYLAIYFELALSEVRMTVNKEVAVISNTGYGASQMIKRQIEAIFGQEIVIESFSEDSYEASDLKKYLAVFSTIPVVEIDKDTLVIQISNIFDKKWVNREIKNLRKNVKLNVSTLDVDFIQLDCNQTYEENLAGMLDRLIKLERVDGGFAKRINERDEKSSMVFENGTAFPHTINFGSDRIILYTGVASEGMKHESGEISFVFILAIPEKMNEKNESVLIQLYDVIFEIASSKTLREELFSIVGKEELLSLLKSKGMVV